MSTPAASLPIDEAVTAITHRLIPVLGAMGVQVVATGDPLEAAVVLPLAPNSNHFGSSYAGSLVAAGEVLGGLLALSALPGDGFVPLVKSLQVEFARPASTDVVARTSMDADTAERVRARAHEVGKADFELVAELTDDHGTVVARTVGQYQLRRM